MPAIGNHTSVTPSNGGYLAQVWLVVFLAIVFGAALAAVQVRLGGVIAANKLNETLAQVPRLVLGPSDAAGTASRRGTIDIIPGSLTVKKGDRSTSYQLFRVDQEKKLSGWVVKTRGQGYADKIDLLIGLDAAMDAITGIFVLEQKETPGLGNKITQPSWRQQFVGQKTALPLTVNQFEGKDDNGIDAITGATISSRSVVEIVNRTIRDTRGQLVADAIRTPERGQ